MAETLGFGILGAGLVVPFHAKSVRDAEGSRLVAFCDIDQEKADQLASQYDARAYYSLEEMPKDPDIDVLNVALPNHLHHDAVPECARAGKHVIIEKPPAMTLRETDNMIRTCKKAGVKFSCTVQCRTRKAIQAIRQAIDSGRFGRLLHGDAYMTWFRTTEYYHSVDWRNSCRCGAGVTAQHAFHYIDLLQYLIGPAARVQARMSKPCASFRAD